jgi:hypothetical protein
MKTQAMDRERTTSLLAAHAERLIGGPEAMQQMAMTDAECDELSPLFQLAEHLRERLTPVRPSATFVRSLSKELAKNARRRVALTKRVRKGLLIGAAAVGSLVSVASVVGAIVFVIVRWRARSHTRAAQA